MKLNRLLEITTILLNKKTVTAAELAERFNVSPRTIYRDIDVLSASGIPVFSTQGSKGGISILEEFTINRTALSSSERDSILFALKTLQTTKYPDIDNILDKLGNALKTNSVDWISIDFSPWGSNPNSYNKFSDIKNAIMHSTVIEIDYINSNNQKSRRKIEPLRLIFKSQAWYLWGFCTAKQDYRTFRISRIKNVFTTNQSFDRSAVHIINENPKAAPNLYNPFIHLVLQFSEAALFRLYDDYDDDMIRKNDDGTYTLELDFPEDEWVYGYILSFGAHVVVVEPDHVRDIIKERAQKINELYK